MSAKKPGKAAPVEVPKIESKDDRRKRLVAEASANPNGFFTFEDAGIILGFGTNAMAALNSAGAPKAFRKMNPPMVRDWIATHQELIGKITGSED